MASVDELLSDLGPALRAAAQLEAEVERLEHLRKVVLADEMPKDLPEWKADAAARSSARYQEFLKGLHNVKTGAGEARAKAEYLRSRLDVWRTRESTRRSQLQQGAGR